MPIKLKRIYDNYSEDDGVRVLVDRVWPRGISKDSAKLDNWMKEIGPTTELRKWFSHDPDKYEAFKQKYKKELESGDQQAELEKLKEITKDHHKDVTLLYAAKDKEHNQAQVLKEILDHQ
ncbi:DUF488 domain-containing protein [Virgibacillus oceani]|uniref:Uroporphyrin-III methyltransferase n=1 Tax=Virgibacillus oceani TaxID=1479511 RepID=A0A917H8N1_9BACI|nr:DUF488 domain-containing protein [Virgibacillus oceani]GGG71035.1 hypothetical protein GCM10011398_14030 [Virgibacillus oceani]